MRHLAEMVLERSIDPEFISEYKERVGPSPQHQMDTLDQPSQSPVSVVYFDGSCPLCSAEMRFCQKRAASGGIQFVDVSEPSAQCGAGLDRETAMARFHIRTAEGTLIAGSAAFVALWGSVYRLPWLERLASSSVGKTLLEAGYRVSLRIRPLLAFAYRRLLH